MKRHFSKVAVVAISLAFCGYSCNRTPAEPKNTEIKIEFETTELESGDRVTRVAEGGWLTIEVPVEVPGRYQTEVRLASGSANPVTCWVETHIDNTDGRTYNITGSLEFPVSDNPDQLFSVSKDGSPLNTGIHKMKLHIGGGEASVDWIKFSLLKQHQKTPETLTQSTEGDEWVVVWSDEFDQGTLPDPEKWTYDIGNWGWGNNELQYYTEARSKNARIENGNLIIESHKNDIQEKWTSARLTTRGKTTFVYGKIEIRAKVPVEKGNWSAGWTLGDKYVDEKSWPYCGEIDIMECVGYEIDDKTGNGLHHASVHCGAYYFKLNNQPTGITEVNSMNTEYHLYAIEWTPDYIKAFVDDVHYFTYEDTSDSLTWPFNEPQNIILNLAMGGGWGGAQGMDESVNSQRIVIDHVRVYERK